MLHLHTIMPQSNFTIFIFILHLIFDLLFFLSKAFPIFSYIQKMFPVQSLFPLPFLLMLFLVFFALYPHILHFRFSYSPFQSLRPLALPFRSRTKAVRQRIHLFFSVAFRAGAISQISRVKSHSTLLLLNPLWIPPTVMHPSYEGLEDGGRVHWHHDSFTFRIRFLRY